MKDEELILKAVEYCNDIPARVKDFLRDQKPIPKEEPKPDFKVGDWIIGVNRTPYDPARITGLNSNGDSVNYLYWNGCEEAPSYQGKNCIRLATPVEIESHLRKICDEKYVGRKVKCLLEDESFSVVEFDQYTACDSLWYKDTEGRVMKVYGQGDWAEILPEKKKLPDNKVDLGRLINLYHNQNDGLPLKEDVIEFLKDYEDYED